MFSCRTLLCPTVRAFIQKWQPRYERGCCRGPVRFLSTASQIPRMAENGAPYTLDGKERVAGLMQHNIGLYGELKKANKLRFKNMSVEIASRHTLQFSDLNYFTTQGWSYTEAVCRRYLADNANPLWWKTQALGSSTAPVVRNKAIARMNVAFRQALRSAGYDSHGKRLPGQQNGLRSGNTTVTHLSGTVVIKAHAPVDIHKMRFGDLQDFCKRVVRGLEEALGQRPGDAGRKAHTAPRERAHGRPGNSNRGGRGGQSGQRPQR